MRRIEELEQMLKDKGKPPVQEMGKMFLNRFGGGESETLFYSGEANGSIRIWNLNSKPKTCQVRIETDQRYSAINAMIKVGNNKVVTASDDTVLRVWDSEEHTFETSGNMTHTSGVNCLANLSTERFISGSNDKSVKIWSSKDFQLLGTLDDLHTSHVLCFLTNEDEKTFYSGGDDAAIKSVNWENTKVIKTFNGHTKAVRSIVQLSPGRIASGSNDRTIRIWDTKQISQIMFIQTNSLEINCMLLIGENKLAVGTANKAIRIYDTNSGTPTGAFPDGENGHKFSVNCMLRIDTTTIATGSADKTIRIWNTEKMECVRVYNPQPSSILCLSC